MNEREAMARAISLAERGWGRVHPNPMVGAVILRDGKAVAEGWHEEFGGAHAEVNALRAAGPLAHGGTCVVTLEPCAHHGKTRPCTDALVAAGIARVVCAVRDPHRAAAGGLEKLRDAGIVADQGLMAEEAARMNASFLCSEGNTERPWIAVKVATSSDGFLARADRQPHWISSPEARQWVHWLRAGFDAIGVGRVTVETDNPQLTVRGDLQPRVAPIRVVFSRSGAVPTDRILFRTPHVAPVIIATSREGAAVAPGEPVVGHDLPALLRGLRARGVRSLLIEGGAGLIQSLLTADLVDRLYWVRARGQMRAGIHAFGEFDPERVERRGWSVIGRQALGADTLMVADRRLCLRGS